MARDSIEDLYKRALKYGRARGLGDEAYDFAGFAALLWLRGKSSHQLIVDTFKDYQRSTQSTLRSTRSTDALSHSSSLSQLPREPRADWHPPLCVDWRALCETKQDRETLELLLQGYSQSDIARELGLTDGAVTLRYKKLIRRMREKLGITIGKETDDEND